MKVRRSLLALFVFVLFLYLLPGRVLLKPIVPYICPSLHVANLPTNVLGVAARVRYAICLIALYVLLYLFVIATLWVLRLYHWEKTIHWLSLLTENRGLEKMDRFVAQLLPLVLIALVPTLFFARTESIVIMLFVAWLGFWEAQRAPAVPHRPPPLPVPVTPLPEDDVPDGDISKVYSWGFPERLPLKTAVRESLFTVSLKISRARYEDLHKKPRDLNPKRWAKYVTQDEPEVDVLAGKLLALGREQGFRSYEVASNTLAFTQQCIRYASDVSPKTGEPMEYPKYPIESLVEEAGDCEDQSILTAALLKNMGYDVALLLFPGHVAVGIAGAEGLPGVYVKDSATGVRYFYAETTADGWVMGEVPEDMRHHLDHGEFEIVPVVKEIEA